MDYGITIRVPVPFAETVTRVRGALRAQGFGVPTEIDVQATLRDKPGEMAGNCRDGPAVRYRTVD